MGGFHVSGCLAMLPEMPPEMRDAQALGITFFAGEAEEGRLDAVMRDAWAGTLAPLYNFMDDLPSLQGEPPPILPRKHVRRTSGSLSSVDLGRGCPYQCSFCTIINVQGRKSRFRSPDDLETIIRENCRAGHQALLHHRRQFCPQPPLGTAVRPDDRAARGRPEHRLHHPGGHAVPSHPELHREGGHAPACGGCSSGWRTSTRRICWPPRSGRTASPNIATMLQAVARGRRHHLCRLHHRLSRRYQGFDPARRRDHQARTAARHPGVLLPDAAAGIGGPQGALAAGHLDGSRSEQVRPQPSRHASCAHVGPRSGRRRIGPRG